MKRKKYNSYELYTRDEMSKISKEEGFLFVETSRDDNYIINKKDVADFIMLESNRCGQNVDMKFYVPNYNITEPFISTYGCFLNKCNQKFRNEIIDRLVILQTTETKPNNVKIFDNEVFADMELTELGEEEGKLLQYDREFKKYYEEEEEMEV